MHITTIGIDIAKTIFHLYAVIRDGLNRDAKTTIQTRPLLERDPTRFWQSVSFFLAVLLFTVLVLKVP